MYPSSEAELSVVKAPDERGRAVPSARRRDGGRIGLASRWNRLSLMWRVFAANAAVAVVAFAVLAWAPVKVDRVATPDELVVLSIGLVLMLAVDLVILRRAFGPLRRLSALMGAVDPGQPGRRATLSRKAGAEVAALAEALNSMLDRLEDERRASGRRALAATEGERARIARELHDEVGQTLTAVALRAERAMGETSAQDEALSEIAETVLRSLEDVHRIGRKLRPEALDELGLVSALIALCSRVTEQGGLTVRRELEWQLPALPDEVELVIYRVAQEALTNALRHADADHATLRLKCVDERVVLVVSDDGRGFPDHAGERGIAGMRERALLIGADLDVHSAAGHGTEIVLSVPVAPEQRW
jgi:two-component system sensor histidine kinase UhpB